MAAVGEGGRGMIYAIEDEHALDELVQEVIAGVEERLRHRFCVKVPSQHFLAGPTRIQNHFTCLLEASKVLCVITPHATHWTHFCLRSAFNKFLFKNREHDIVVVLAGFPTYKSALDACPDFIEDQTLIIFSNHCCLQDDIRSWRRLESSMLNWSTPGHGHRIVNHFEPQGIQPRSQTITGLVIHLCDSLTPFMPCL